MSKVNTFEEAIKLLQTLKGYANDVDEYEDDFFDDYRQIARVSSRELIDTLLELEISDELMQKTENVVPKKEETNENTLSYAEQAVLFIKENPGVASEVHKHIDKAHHREDIVSKLEERGITGVTDADIDKLIESFERALSKNDGYYESFWASADYVIDEYEGNTVQKSTVSRKDIPPSLDELVREYEHFVEVTKDIRTVEQARVFQEQYHIPVEINGVSIDEYVNDGGHLNKGKTNENIEWIRYEYFGNLSYIYDHFDGAPQFDVYYGVYGDSMLAENVTFSGLKQAYSEFMLDEVCRLAKDELSVNENFGYTMPDGKHHIYIFVDDSIKFADGSKTREDGFYEIEPNRVVDGAMEPMGENVTADYGDIDELRKGVQWCFEQFEADKEASLDNILNDATLRSAAENKVSTKEANKENIDISI